MLAWPHSGFHVHDGVWVAADDREFAVRLARYCARNPVALSRLEYKSDTATVTYRSDKPTGPTADSETVDVLEFLSKGCGARIARLAARHLESRLVGLMCDGQRPAMKPKDRAYRGSLRCKSTLGGGGLGGEPCRIRMAETVFGAVVLRVLAGARPRGFKKDGILARNGSYGVLAKTS